MAIAKSGMSDQRRDGWFNFCQHCGKQYWVSARDTQKPKMIRYVDDDEQERHQCNTDS